MPIPLHLPSHWSFGHGVASVAEIAEGAAAWGLPAIALTDIETLCGAIEFHHRCRAAGVRPILGVELRAGFLSAGRRSETGNRPGRLVLLARDRAGYRSLSRIVSRRRVEGHGVPAGDPVSDLLADPDGLFALTDDPEAAGRLLGAGFPARFARLLLVRPRRSARAEARILDASRRLGLPLVADQDARGVLPADETLLRLQRAIRLGLPVRKTALAGYRSLLPPERARALFADLPGAVEETRRVAEACASDVLPDGAGAPRPKLRPGETPAAGLRGRARAVLDGARAGEPPVGSRYEDRLERELGVIDALGLASWFLVLEEVAAFARRRRIEILVRGSAVGSLVIHLLGLSPVDPVAEDLLFERFLRPGRDSPFDVDLDLPSRRREEVLEWVLARWAGYAASVGAHQRFGVRSARREAEAAMAGYAPVDEGILDRLVGAPRGLSVHPGGVVLAGIPIRDVLPLAMAPKGVAATQFDGRSLDSLGIAKLDFLGNTCLDEIALASGIAGRAAIPLDDPATLGRLSAGDTVGCSQIETPATRAALRRRPIRSIDDLTAALAAVRPGPSSDGPLFEEDVVRLLSLEGTLTIEEADGWRAAIVATGGDEDGLARLERRYIDLALARGSTRDRVRAAWSQAAPFASYAFSKAHAASYALLAYRAAFLRTNYPAAWGCAVLDAHGGAYPARTVAAEVARWGVAIKPPSVNGSGPRTEIVAGSELLLGLERLRGVSARTKTAILDSRKASGPYAGLADLVRRVRPGATELEALVLSGACDGLAPLTPAGYPFVHEALLAALRSGARMEHAMSLSWTVDLGGPARADELARYRALVRARNELRYLGAAPSGHPLAILRRRLAGEGVRTIADALATGADDRVAIAGLPAATRRVETSRGPMRFVTWEDETGLLESRIGPRAYGRLAARFRPEAAFRVVGRLTRGDGGPRVDVRNLAPLRPAHARKPPYGVRRPAGVG